MLTIRNFEKGYGDTIILSIPHLTFVSGTYWIKGENGSGKTTFFKSLSGILPCSGSLEFDDGVSLRDHPLAYRARVNYSEAEPLYPGFLTPRDLARFIGMTKGAQATQQESLFKLFGIDLFQDKPCSTCSSGMVKKLSLALAFLGQPKVVILDEPIITLDERSRETLFTLLNQHIEEQQITCLISSHQPLETSTVRLAASYVLQKQQLVLI